MTRKLVFVWDLGGKENVSPEATNHRTVPRSWVCSGEPQIRNYHKKWSWACDLPKLRRSKYKMTSEGPSEVQVTWGSYTAPEAYSSKVTNGTKLWWTRLKIGDKCRLKYLKLQVKELCRSYNAFNVFKLFKLAKIMKWNSKPITVKYYK